MTEVHDIETSFRQMVSAIQRDDVEAAVEHFAEDGMVVDYSSPETPLVGRAAIAEVLNGFWALMPDMTFEVTGILAGPDRVSGELEIHGTPVGQDDPVVLRYGVFEQYRDGKIIVEHLYADSRQLPDGL